MNMSSDNDLEFSNARALIGLWQDEEERLHKIHADQATSPEIRQQVNIRLEFVRDQILDSEEELERLSRR
jgi:hypothetical protein